jgi:hypothetical protein
VTKLEGLGVAKLGEMVAKLEGKIDYFGRDEC